MLSFKRTVLYVLVLAQLTLALSCMGVNWFQLYATTGADQRMQSFNIFGLEKENIHHISWKDYKEVNHRGNLATENNCIRDQVIPKLQGAGALAIVAAFLFMVITVVYTCNYFSLACTHKRSWTHVFTLILQIIALVFVGLSWVVFAAGIGTSCKYATGKDKSYLDAGKYVGGFHLAVINSAVNIIVLALFATKFDMDGEVDGQVDGQLTHKNSANLPKYGWKKKMLAAGLFFAIVLNAASIGSPWIKSIKSVPTLRSVATVKTEHMYGSIFGVSLEGTTTAWLDYSLDECVFRAWSEHITATAVLQFASLAVALIVFTWTAAKGYSRFCSGPTMKWTHWFLLFAHIFGAGCQMISWVTFAAAFRYNKCKNVNGISRNRMLDDWDLHAGFALAVVQFGANLVIMIFLILRWDEEFAGKTEDGVHRKIVDYEPVPAPAKTLPVDDEEAQPDQLQITNDHGDEN